MEPHSVSLTSKVMSPSRVMQGVDLPSCREVPNRFTGEGGSHPGLRPLTCCSLCSESPIP